VNRTGPGNLLGDSARHLDNKLESTYCFDYSILQFGNSSWTSFQRLDPGKDVLEEAASVFSHSGPPMWLDSCDLRERIIAALESGERTGLVSPLWLSASRSTLIKVGAKLRSDLCPQQQQQAVARLALVKRSQSEASSR
jgi:hypothetical protein